MIGRALAFLPVLLLLAFQGWSIDSDSFLSMQGAPAQAWLGGLRRLPEPVAGMGSAPLSLQWVDAERLLALAATQGSWELRLVTPAGMQTLAQLWGEGVGYDFRLITEP